MLTLKKNEKGRQKLSVLPLQLFCKYKTISKQKVLEVLMKKLKGKPVLLYCICKMQIKEHICKYSQPWIQTAIISTAADWGSGSRFSFFLSFFFLPLFIFFSIFKKLFKYSSLHFLPQYSPLLHPSPPPTLNLIPLWLCPCVLYTCSWMDLPLFSSIIHLPLPPQVTVSFSLFQEVIN